MCNLKWSEIDIEDELSKMESLLSTSLIMNLSNEIERGIAVDLMDMLLLRVRKLKKLKGSDHA
ncbi:hypothetical protein DMO59_08870 [Salmonella enterica subsp. diarizonae]|uniref:Uncharacterized protein n=1 Tax=Salmonella enterica TaxID=28901 RepID=A0A3R0CL96_SALER|nr:hypothetical protein [Salmonella enterica]ECJ4481184.1 hypothetical protein [Salmonella enterica subsp. diarizonae]EAP6363924.1 hypothetical protein [Salmonella enterica]EAR9443298.1 hypothetical protein [Salmonella enterica]EAS3314571.1 hypothetical protein [Salmonella enterica]